MGRDNLAGEYIVTEEEREKNEGETARYSANGLFTFVANQMRYGSRRGEAFMGLTMKGNQIGVI